MNNCAGAADADAAATETATDSTQVFAISVVLHSGPDDHSNRGRCLAEWNGASTLLLVPALEWGESIHVNGFSEEFFK